TAHAALPAGEPHPVGSTGLGRRQRVEGATCHYLLAGDGTFGTPATDEADRPVQQRGDPLFEADQVEQVDDQPDQPGNESGETEPADAGHSGKPRDRRHTPLVDILERFVQVPTGNRAAVTLAACLPDCVATCATPGTPASIMSPMTKTSGNRDSEQSSRAGTRPARSTCRPACLARCLANGEAATPAAHTLVRLWMRRVLPSASLMSMPNSSMSTTTAPNCTWTPSCTSTPSCPSFLVALAARCCPNVPSTVLAPSSRTTRARRGSMRRESFRRVLC